MESINYKTPFNPQKAMLSNGNIETCSMTESIAQNIMLLITTKKGENRNDENYGNDVWDIEFDNGVSEARWERIFVNGMKRQIKDYEPRLTNPSIQACISYVEHSYETRKFSEIKRKVKIAINATMESSGERFNFATELFLSPMSVD